MTNYVATYTAENIGEASTAELVAFWNSKKAFEQIQKFSDRKSAERRILKLEEQLKDVAEIEAADAIANGTPEPEEAAPAKKARAAKKDPIKEAAEHVKAGMKEVRGGIKAIVHHDMVKKEKETVEDAVGAVALQISAATGLTPEAILGKPEAKAPEQASSGPATAQAAQIEHAKDAPTSENTQEGPKDDEAEASPQRDIVKARTGGSNAAGVAASWLRQDVRDARAQRDGVTVETDAGVTEHKSVKAAFRAYYLPDSKHIRFRMALKASKAETFEHDGKKYDFKIAKVSEAAK